MASPTVWTYHPGGMEPGWPTDDVTEEQRAEMAVQRGLTVAQLDELAYAWRHFDGQPMYTPYGQAAKPKAAAAPAAEPETPPKK